MNHDAVDHQNPRSLLEQSEEEVTPTNDLSPEGLRHVLAWILDGRSLASIGTRAYVCAYAVTPDVINGMTCDSIAKMSGHGRSAVHNLAREFEEVFHVRTAHARSEEARRHYSLSFHARNGTKPHQYNPRKPS